MYSRPSVVLLAAVVRVTGNGKCKSKDIVEVSAQSLDGIPYANSHGYVDTLVVEMQPSLQGRQSPEDGSHDGQRQPNSGGSARERWRRGTSAGRRPRAAARISAAYRLWAVPLAALAVLLVFSALQRRCADLRKRERASAAGGAFLRRLDASFLRLWAICTGRFPGEGGGDTLPLMNHGLVNIWVDDGAGEGDAPEGDVPHVLITMEGPANPPAAERHRKHDILIIAQITLASLIFVALAIYEFYTIFTVASAHVPQNNVTVPGSSSTVEPFLEPPRMGTSTGGFGPQSMSLSTAEADASSGGHSAATSDVPASESPTSGTNVSAGEVEAVITDSQPTANSTAGAGMDRTQ